MEVRAPTTALAFTPRRQRATTPLRTGRCPADAPVHGPLFWRADSPYMGHLRIMSEGCQGALKAWLLKKDKVAWLAFARKFGDFLVAHQAADGSIAGECEPLTTVYACAMVTLRSASQQTGLSLRDARFCWAWAVAVPVLSLLSRPDCHCATCHVWSLRSSQQISS